MALHIAYLIIVGGFFWIERVHSGKLRTKALNTIDAAFEEVNLLHESSH